mmetsp:Transcript_68224/g.160453  ORF Transcript_68224/g.160453 Transcript_68224/m.160453 type:complete len:93 (+) Transcript_68224:905-1183(+)
MVALESNLVDTQRVECSQCCSKRIFGFAKGISPVPMSNTKFSKDVVGSEADKFPASTLFSNKSQFFYKEDSFSTHFFWSSRNALERVRRNGT